MSDRANLPFFFFTFVVDLADMFITSGMEVFESDMFKVIFLSCVLMTCLFSKMRFIRKFKP